MYFFGTEQLQDWMGQKPVYSNQLKKEKIMSVHSPRVPSPGSMGTQLWDSKEPDKQICSCCKPSEKEKKKRGGSPTIVLNNHDPNKPPIRSSLLKIPLPSDRTALDFNTWALGGF